MLVGAISFIPANRMSQFLVRIAMNSDRYEAMSSMTNWVQNLQVSSRDAMQDKNCRNPSRNDPKSVDNDLKHVLEISCRWDDHFNQTCFCDGIIL